MRKLLLIAILLYSGVSNSSGAAQFLAEMTRMVYKEIVIFEAKIKSIFSSSSAVVTAEKKTSDTISAQALASTKEQLMNQIDREIGVDSYVTFGVDRFLISATAPTGCHRASNSEKSIKQSIEVEPLIKELKEDLQNSVSTDTSTIRTRVERGARLANIFHEYENTMESISPLQINGPIDVTQAQRMQEVIKYVSNPNPFQKDTSPNNFAKGYEYHVLRVRYELMVDVLQDVMMNHVKHFVKIEGGMSDHEKLIDIKAISESSKLSKSLSTKYESGVLKEINETVANQIILESIKQKIVSDNVALMSLLATGATDEIAKDILR